SPTPSDDGAVAPERTGLRERIDVPVWRILAHRSRIGCDVESVGGAVDLAHEAGLAVLLVRDNGKPVGRTLEDVGRAHRDADVARDAPLRDDHLDHRFAPRRTRCPSARTSTRSRPL